MGYLSSNQEDGSNDDEEGDTTEAAEGLRHPSDNWLQHATFFCFQRVANRHGGGYQNDKFPIHTFGYEVGEVNVRFTIFLLYKCQCNHAKRANT